MKAALIATLVFVLAACDKSTEYDFRMAPRHTYSLCPIGTESKEHLNALARHFAEREGARLIDRGADAQDELAGIGAGVLNRTGGDLVLLTIESPGRFRITISNLGLLEKLGLAIRYGNEAGYDGAIDTLLADIERFWRVQEVDGGLTNDPPCASSPGL